MPVNSENYIFFWLMISFSYVLKYFKTSQKFSRMESPLTTLHTTIIINHSLEEKGRDKNKKERNHL